MTRRSVSTNGLTPEQVRDNALGALDELQSIELYSNDRYPAYESEYWVRWEDIKDRVLPLLLRIANGPTDESLPYPHSGDGE